MWENPNMASHRLEAVKKFFKKIEFLKMSKSRNISKLYKFSIKL